MLKDIVYREDAVNAIEREYICTDKSDDWNGLETAISILESEDEVPSVQPEIIYCEYCIHSYLFRPWDALDGESESRFCRKFRQSLVSDYDMAVEDDDYCSFAERK